VNVRTNLVCGSPCACSLGVLMKHDQRHGREGVKVNLNAKGGVKGGTLGLWEIFKAKWIMNHKWWRLNQRKSTRPKKKLHRLKSNNLPKWGKLCWSDDCFKVNKIT